MGVAMRAVALSPVCELVSNECASQGSVGFWGAVCKGRSGNEKEGDEVDLHSLWTMCCWLEME